MLEFHFGKTHKSCSLERLHLVEADLELLYYFGVCFSCQQNPKFLWVTWLPKYS